MVLMARGGTASDRSRRGSVRELRMHSGVRSAEVLLACAACIGFGCTVGDADRDVEQTSLDRVEAYQGLTRINTQPYTSDVGTFAINCYVSGDVADYRKIHP